MNVMFHTTSSLVDRGISSAPDREPAAVVRAGDDVRVGVDVVERRDSVEDVVAVVELDERVRRLGTEHIDLWINQPVSPEGSSCAKSFLGGPSLETLSSRRRVTRVNGVEVDALNAP